MFGVATTHPEPEHLRRFGLGQLEDAEARVVEGHVAGCDVCAATLEQVPNDTLVGLLCKGDTASETPALAPAAPAPEARPEAPPGPTQAAEVLGLVEATDPAGVPAPLRDHPRYRILRLLGEGGMGSVYLALHQHLGRPVALKVIKPSLLEDAGAVQRFRQEMRAVAELSHPNIVQAHDADQAGDLHFFVMEFVEGTSLAELVGARGPLPVTEACGYVRQAALGLQHAFERGLSHRDIKPHNLMLARDGQIKILDFGLARVVIEQEANATHLTGTGTALGTADYMAPEQGRDAHQADIRADIYSLGCTLYHLLTGRPPHPGGTSIEKILKHATDDPTPLGELRAELPAGLEGVVTRMLAKNPADRYQTPAEVVAALEAVSQEAVAVPALPITAAAAGGTLAFTVRRGETGALIESGLCVAVPAVASQTAVRSAEVGRAPQVAGGGRKRLRRWTVALCAGGVAALVLTSVLAYRLTRPAPTPVKYGGWVDVIVWDEKDPTRQRRRLGDPVMLPLRPDDEVRLEAAVEPAAYLYLFWIDTEGVVTPIYPWRGDWKNGRGLEEPRSRLSFPEQPGMGAPVPPEGRGMETVLLLACDAPLPAELDVAALFQGLPPQRPWQNERAAVWFQDGEIVTGEPDRAPQFFSNLRPIDDPVLLLQRLLREKVMVQPHVRFSRAVSFAKQGELVQP